MTEEYAKFTDHENLMLDNILYEVEQSFFPKPVIHDVRTEINGDEILGIFEFEEGSDHVVHIDRKTMKIIKE